MAFFGNNGGNNGGGNPYHDENGRFTSDSNKSGINNNGFKDFDGEQNNPWKNIKPTNKIGWNPMIGKYNSPTEYNVDKFNKNQEKLFKKLGLTPNKKSNPMNLSVDDFKFVNGNQKFGLESALQNLQSKYIALANVNGRTGTELQEYNDAYNSFWQKYGSIYKEEQTQENVEDKVRAMGFNGDDNPVKIKFGDKK